MSTARPPITPAPVAAREPIGPAARALVLAERQASQAEAKRGYKAARRRRNMAADADAAQAADPDAPQASQEAAGAIDGPPVDPTPVLAPDTFPWCPDRLTVGGRCSGRLCSGERFEMPPICLSHYKRRSRQAERDARDIVPCTQCGTTGGVVHPGARRPSRFRVVRDGETWTLCHECRWPGTVDAAPASSPDAPPGVDAIRAAALEIKRASPPCIADDVLARHAAGELTQDHRNGIDRHLSECPDCRARLAGQSKSERDRGPMASVIEAARKREKDRAAWVPDLEATVWVCRLEPEPEPEMEVRAKKTKPAAWSVRPFSDPIERMD